MEVEGAESGDAPYFLRQHPEGHHDEHVGLPCLEGREEPGILEPDGLQHRNAVLHRIALDRAFVELEPAAALLVRDGHDSDHLVAVPDERVKRAYGEFGSSHVDYAHWAEETRHLALLPAPPYLELVHIENFRVVYSLPGEERADRNQHVCRNERPGRRVDGAVSRQLGAGDVHHPVEHEEQHRNDGARAEPALAYQRTERRSDEEQYEAGEGLGELLEQFDVSVPHIVVLLEHIELQTVDVGVEGRGPLGRLAVRPDLAFRIGPAQVVVALEFAAVGIPHRGVELDALQESPHLADGRVVDGVHGVDEMVQRIAFVPELRGAHRLGLVAETAGVGLLEAVVVEGDYELLPVEVDMLQHQSCVGISYSVVFLIVGAVEKSEHQVVLAL